MHTLVLLDVKSDKGKYMSIPEAAEMLLELETEMKGGLFRKDTNIIAVCRLGRKDQIIKHAQIGVLADYHDLDTKTPAVVIVPGEMHFMEEEYLNCVSK